MYAKFPMTYVNITQIPNGGYSHRGRLTVDNAGKDTKIDDVFAPFDCKIVWKDNPRSNTGIMITNTTDLLCADGVTRAPYTVNMILWHDNEIADLYVGKEIKQGTVFYQEGTAGEASGNHLHFGLSTGKYTGGYPMVQNEFSNWELKNEIHPTKILFVTNDNIIVKDMGMNWVKYAEPTKVVTDVSKVPSAALVVGDKVKITGTNYATGQKVPTSIKSKTFTIGRIDGGRVLLKEIVSWVYVKDVVKS